MGRGGSATLGQGGLHSRRGQRGHFGKLAFTSKFSFQAGRIREKRAWNFAPVSKLILTSYFLLPLFHEARSTPGGGRGLTRRADLGRGADWPEGGLDAEERMRLQGAEGSLGGPFLESGYPAGSPAYMAHNVRISVCAHYP